MSQATSVATISTMHSASSAKHPAVRPSPERQSEAPARLNTAEGHLEAQAETQKAMLWLEGAAAADLELRRVICDVLHERLGGTWQLMVASPMTKAPPLRLDLAGAVPWQQAATADALAQASSGCGSFYGSASQPSSGHFNYPPPLPQGLPLPPVHALPVPEVSAYPIGAPDAFELECEQATPVSDPEEGPDQKALLLRMMQEDWPPKYKQEAEHGDGGAADAEQTSKTSTDAVTTLMLQRLPTAYTRQQLLQELGNLVDYVHMPINVKTKAHLGYAFLNFEEHKVAKHFLAAHEGTGYIATEAKVQGFEKNVLSYMTKRSYTNDDKLRPWIKKDEQWHVLTAESVPEWIQEKLPKKIKEKGKPEKKTPPSPERPRASSSQHRGQKKGKTAGNGGGRGSSSFFGQ